MVITQGDICWAELEDPQGSEAGFRRPVVVVQCNALNQSLLRTVICIPLTSNLRWADAPGNVFLRKSLTGLSKDSVAVVTQITAIDKSHLSKRIQQLPEKQIRSILSGVDTVLGR